MTDVKIVKKGNGIPQMTYQSRVATFDQFRKSPDKYTKGTTAPSSADVKSEGGDKDYKQLLIKENTDGTLSATQPEVQAQPKPEAQGQNKSLADLIKDGIVNIEKSDLSAEEKQKSIEGLNQFKGLIDKMDDGKQDKVIDTVLNVVQAQPSVNESISINESDLRTIAKALLIGGGIGTAALAVAGALGKYDVMMSILQTADALGLSSDPSMLNTYAVGVGLLGSALASVGVKMAVNDIENE